MLQFFTDFIENIDNSIYALAVHAGFFFLLFLLTEKNLTGRYMNLKRADNENGFLGRDFKIDVCYFFLNKLITFILAGYLVTVLTVTIMDHYMPAHILNGHIEHMPFAIQLLIGLFIADAAFFFPHWFAHKFLWRFHSIHHSAEKINWTTALRLHPVDELPFIIGGAILMHILGFEGQAIILALILHNAYNMFVHANIALDYPKPLCYILGSPNYHRWHHAAQKAAIDKNFATMFPIFDLVFGTYYYPQGRLPDSYGLYGDAQKSFPKSFFGQLIYPFKIKKK